MHNEPDDEQDDDDGEPPTAAELAVARVRHAAMEPCIPELFAGPPVTGNGVTGDRLAPAVAGVPGDPASVRPAGSP